jgi:hypothetical protein
MKTQNQASKLLIFLLILLLGAVHYFFTFPLIKQNDTKKTKVEADTRQRDEYQIISEEMKNYDMIKQQVDAEQLELIKTLPPSIYEENIIGEIVSLNKITDKQGKNFPALKSVSFEIGSKGEQQSANAETEASSDNNLAKFSAVLGYKLKYGVLKNMLEKIPTLQPKIVLYSASITKSLEEEALADPYVNAQLTLNFYGYKDDDNIDKMQEVIKYTDVYQRLAILLRQANPNAVVINPFYSTAAKAAPAINKNLPGQASMQPYDFFTILSPDKFDTPAIMFGKMGDGQKQISDDKNQPYYIEFVFLKNAQGKYLCKYRMGNNSIPKNYSQMEVFNPVDFNKITLNVLSQIPSNSTDQIRTNISISNGTDIPVEVKINNDNTLNKRVVINNIGQGTVVPIWK